MHTVTKLWPCPKCPGLEFNRKSILDGHLMYHHIKVKPYVCATCGLEFYKKWKCWQHIASVHEGWPKERAEKEWKYLLREKPELLTVNRIRDEINKILGWPLQGESAAP